MGFFSFLFSGIGALFGAVTEVVSDVVSTVSSIFSLKKSIDKVKRGTYDKVSKKQEAIHYLNDEIIALRKRYENNGYLTEREKKRIKYLAEERDHIKSEIDSERRTIAAQKFIDNEDVNKKVLINNNSTHILQWNAFADTMGKICPKCGRVMKIQWQQNLQHVKSNEFFWGCTGWYINACSYKEKLTASDLSLMTDASAPEFELSSEDFTTILHDPGTAKLITERVDDLQSDLWQHKKGIEIVCCPTHGEPMVLQKKKNAIGLLDQYYLRCPHWKPNDQGCGYVEKLKSGSQLAALLKDQTGRGIL